MRKKIIVMVVTTLLILTATSAIGFVIDNEKAIPNGDDVYSNNLPPDELDQEQTEWCSEGVIIRTNAIAQSFKPTLNKLTRIEILVENYGGGNPQYLNYYLVVKESLDGPAIFSGSSNTMGGLPTDETAWIEFDHADCDVTPGNTYYIVASAFGASGGSEPIWWKHWQISNEDKYTRGDPWEYIDGSWQRITYASDFAFKTYGYNQENNPPNKPEPVQGPSSGNVFESYTYTTSATDPDNDQIYIVIYWGDGGNSGWIGPRNSGDSVTPKHMWWAEGTYNIRAKAMDEHGAESELSDPLIVTMPKSKSYNMCFLQLFNNCHFLQRFLSTL